MAEDTIEQAAIIAGLAPVPSVSSDLPIHGYHHHSGKYGAFSVYGSDAPALQDLVNEDPRNAEPLHSGFDFKAAQVIWAIEHEMARTVEDFLARRTRALLLNARASIECAPKVAGLMAEKLNRSIQWQQDQIVSYKAIARNYMIS